MNRFGLLLAASAISVATASVAQAQTAPLSVPVSPDNSVPQDKAPTDANSGDIIVTARRVSESQQNVPMSLTAVTGDELERRGVASVIDLQRLVPSLNVSASLNRNATSFTIRGQRATPTSTGTGGGASVVTYFAEAPFPGNGPGLFFDLQNVQVLNGPQGTLFGQNTTGGAVLFEPTRPTNTFEGYLMGTTGSYGRLDTEGVVNIPIVSDKVLLRAGFQSLNRDGFTRDIRTGRKYDNRDAQNFRASLILRPSDRFENYTIAYLMKSDENGPGVVLIAANPAKPIGAAIIPTLNAQNARGVRSVQLDAHSLDTTNYLSVINRTTFNINDQLTLTNIFSWGHFRSSSGRDDDGTPLPIQNSNGPSIPGTWASDLIQLTEELRLSGSVGNKFLNFQLGGYWDKNVPGGLITYTQNLQTTTTSSQPNATPRARSRALFGQIGLDMGKVVPALAGLNLTAGYRYTWNDFSIGLALLSYPGILYPPPPPQPGDSCTLPPGKKYPNCFFSAAGSSHGESFNFGTDYKIFDRVMVFANYKRGYKPGGFNATLVALGAGANTVGFAYGPEKVDALEGGVKTEWKALGISGHFNATGYINKYDDIQVQVPILIGVLTSNGIQNAAKATTKGVELEGELRFSRLFSINGGYSYIDARYDRYMAGSTDLSKLPFVFTPKHQWNASANLNLPVSDSIGEIALSGNYSWKGTTYVGDTNPTQPFSYVPSYAVVGARADWKNFLDTKNIDLAFFVTNLTNKVYRLNVIQQYAATGYTTALFSEPRMYGASLKVHF